MQATTRLPAYVAAYIDQLKGTTFLEQLSKAEVQFIDLISGIPESHWDYAYAEGKWTIKEVVVHMLDTERILSYRAMRFSRNDQTPLAGFEENLYTPNSGATKRTSFSIIEEYKAVRRSTLLLFENMDDEMLQRTGTASGYEIKVAEIGAMIAGHEMHHIKILRERYLVPHQP